MSESDLYYPEMVSEDRMKIPMAGRSVSEARVLAVGTAFIAIGVIGILSTISSNSSDPFCGLLCGILFPISGLLIMLNHSYITIDRKELSIVVWLNLRLPYTEGGLKRISRVRGLDDFTTIVIFEREEVQSPKKVYRIAGVPVYMKGRGPDGSMKVPVFSIWLTGRGEPFGLGKTEDIKEAFSMTEYYMKFLRIPVKHEIADGVFQSKPKTSIRPSETVPLAGGMDSYKGSEKESRTCPKCQQEIHITSLERPLKITCPGCAASYVIRDQSYSEHQYREQQHKEQQHVGQPHEEQIDEGGTKPEPQVTASASTFIYGSKTCPKCTCKIPITSEERPLKVTCPNCGVSYQLKKKPE